MTIKQFITAAKADDELGAIGEDQVIEVDGRTITFYAPTAGQLAVAMADAAGYNEGSAGAASSINFFFSLLEDDDADYFRARLFDRKDPFGIEEIGELSKDLMADWAATPTKQPSDYLPSQSSDGQKSTGRRPRPAHHRP